MKAPFVIGRMIFGGYFIHAGINHFIHANQITQYAEAKSIPQPDLAVKASGVALMAGGASILLGVKPKIRSSGAGRIPGRRFARHAPLLGR